MTESTQPNSVVLAVWLHPDMPNTDPGAYSRLALGVANVGTEVLRKVEVRVVCDVAEVTAYQTDGVPGDLLAGQRHAEPLLQQIKVPPEGGHLTARVECSCRLPSGRTLEFTSATLELNFPTARSANRKLRIGSMDTSVFERAPDEFGDVDIGQMKSSMIVDPGLNPQPSGTPPPRGAKLPKVFDFDSAISIKLMFKTAFDPVLQSEQIKAAHSPDLLALAQTWHGPRGTDIVIPNLTARDVGRNRVAQTLRIGDTLRLTTQVHRSGYLTLLHVGTSGNTYLFVPNKLTASGAAQVSAGEHYTLPGKPLMPWRDGVAFEVQGDPGYEHFFATITDRPLVSSSMLAVCEDMGLEYRVPPAVVTQLVQTIRDAPGATLDMASFVVVA